MGDVIGQILPLAVGVALSAVPIIAVILILFTPKAKSNGIAFVVGWMMGILVVGGIVLAFGDVASDDGGESTVSGVVKLLLGLLFLALAVRYWRSRPKEGEESEMPAWMGALDDFGAGKSFGIASLLSGVNPKNLALTVAAASVIAAAGLSTGEEVAALAVFTILASLTVALPVLVYLILGDRAEDGLISLKDWLSVNNAVIMAVLLLVFAAKLIGDGITILSG
jgi:threonine/homoserine/homoserine lactone efflux protein